MRLEVQGRVNKEIQEIQKQIQQNSIVSVLVWMQGSGGINILNPYQFILGKEGKGWSLWYHKVRRIIQAALFCRFYTFSHPDFTLQIDDCAAAAQKGIIQTFFSNIAKKRTCKVSLPFITILPHNLCQTRPFPRILQSHSSWYGGMKHCCLPRYPVAWGSDYNEGAFIMAIALQAALTIKRGNPVWILWASWLFFL